MAGLVLIGCGPAPEGQKKSTGQEVIETITQKNTMDAYKKARGTLEAVQSQKN